MQVYHEIQPDELGSALQNGLMRADRGEKSNDLSIVKTDHFLDEHCPERLKELGVKRTSTIYAYLRVGDSIVDIVDGARRAVYDFIASSKQIVLELDIDPNRCFVSDLDTYDAVKSALSNHENQQVLDTLARSYWSKIRPLSEFEPSMVQRPEAMITYDIPASSLRRV